MNCIAILIALSIFSTMHIHTMQQPQICYLTMLPDNILDYIAATYLTFYDIESTEELIKRTQMRLKEEVPAKYYFKKLQLPRETDRFGYIDYDDVFGKNSLTAYCSNEVNVAILYYHHLKIVNTKKDKLLYRKDLEKSEYDFLALSRNADMIATIYEKTNYSTPIHTKTNHLVIMNLVTQKEQIIEIPADFNLDFLGEHSWISFAFNKQGTDIIIQRNYKEPDNIATEDIASVKEYKTPSSFLIFAVTVNTNAIPQKTFQHYLKSTGICKFFR